MAVKVSNNAAGTLASGINTVATVITLGTGQGAKFPTLTSVDWCWCTLSNLSGTTEVVKVTAITGDVMTVVRGQDGTTASAYLAGDSVELRPTAALFNDKTGASDVQAAAQTLLGSVSGVSTITAAASPTLLTQASVGSLWKLPAAGANPGAVTLNIDGQGAVSVLRPDGTALQANDIPAAGYPALVEKRASDFILLNPANLIAQQLLPIQSSAATLLGTVAGISTITAAASPTLLTQASVGSLWKLPAAGANPGAVTLNIDGQGAVSVLRPDGTALQANDIPAAGYPALVEKRASDFILLNPANLIAQQLAQTLAQATAQAQLYAQSYDQSGAATLLGTVAGTSTITAAATPTLTAPAAVGSLWKLPAAGANVGATTLNIDGQGAVSVLRPDGTALQDGDISAAGYPALVEKRASDFVLLNPAGYAQLKGSKGIGVMKFGCLNIAQNSTVWLASPGSVARTAAVNAGRVASQDIVISELRVVLSAAVPASNSIVLTIGVNGTDTAMTCTIGAGATTGSDITHTVKIAAGSYYYLKAVTSATFGNANDIGATVIVRDVNNSYGLTPLHFGAFSGAGGTFAVFGDNDANSAQTVANCFISVPPCFISYRLSGILSTTGLATSGQTENPQKNGVVFLTTNGALGGFPSPRSVFVDGDTFVTTLSNTGAGTVYAQSLVVDPAISTSYPPCFTAYSSNGQAQASTFYMGAYASSAAMSTVETDVQIPMPACTVRNLRVTSSSAVAATTTVITVRKNGVDTALTATLTTSGTVANDLTDTVTFAAGDILSVKCVSGATTGSRSYNATFEILA